MTLQFIEDQEGLSRVFETRHEMECTIKSAEHHRAQWMAIWGWTQVPRCSLGPVVMVCTKRAVGICPDLDEEVGRNSDRPHKRRQNSARVQWCQPKHGHDRICWLSRKSLEKRPCTRCLKAETGYIPLVKLTPMALEIDHRDLPNRVGRGHVCTTHAQTPPGLQRGVKPTHGAVERLD